jgi:hypothetical protein
MKVSIVVSHSKQNKNGTRFAEVPLLHISTAGIPGAIIIAMFYKN